MFVCVFREQGLAQASTLRGHIQRHTKEKPYYCPVCENADLKRHQKPPKKRQASLTNNLLHCAQGQNEQIEFI